MNFTVAELFDLDQTQHATLFDGCHYAWEALKKIEAYLANIPPQNIVAMLDAVAEFNRS